MIDKYRLDDLRLESGEKGELARWVIQLQTDLDSERRKAGNSPVIPDGWIPVSERMPTKHDGTVFLTWNGQYIGKELFLMGSFQCLKPEIITHWMPLPAAPQQEAE